MLRTCKRCGVIYKTEAKTSKICINCYKKPYSYRVHTEINRGGKGEVFRKLEEL